MRSFAGVWSKFSVPFSSEILTFAYSPRILFAAYSSHLSLNSSSLISESSSFEALASIIRPLPLRMPSPRPNPPRSTLNLLKNLSTLKTSCLNISDGSPACAIRARVLSTKLFSSAAFSLSVFGSSPFILPQMLILSSLV